MQLSCCASSRFAVHWAQLPEAGIIISWHQQLNKPLLVIIALAQFSQVIPICIVV